MGSKILIDQCAYLDKLLNQFGLLNAQTAPTPLLERYYPLINNEAADPETRSLFQTLIRSLLYIALGTRPDISYAVASLSWHSANPNREHIRMATRVFQYLLGARHYFLIYDGKPNNGLIAFVDSDWASDPDSHQSHTGWIIKLAGGVFSWTSRQQKNITYSSTEAEYVATNDCARQAVWIRNILGEMGYNIKPFPICVDNQGAIFMASNPITKYCNKHVDICHKGINEFVRDKKIDLFYIEGSENPADMFKKSLSHILFTKFRSQLGLVFYDIPQAARSAIRCLSTPHQLLSKGEC